MRLRLPPAGARDVVTTPPPVVACSAGALARVSARYVLWAWVLSLPILLTGCRERAVTLLEVTLECRVAPDPPRVGPATVTLALADADGKPLEDARISVEGNMSHPGMKPVFGSAREVRPGRYEAPLEFTMGGDWFLIIDATLPDGRTMRRQVDVRGVRTGSEP